VKKERIGIFGGTFNPVHSGHLRAAGLVQRKFSLDKILFVPSFIPPHKESQDIASPLDRMKMVELALQAYPRFIPCSIEIDAREKSYSIITLNKIKKFYPNAWLFFILGIDAFLEIETWKDWQRILDKCLFIVITRPGYQLREAKKVLSQDYRKKIYEICPPQKVREEWFSSYRIFLLPIRALNISSTEVRQWAKKGKPLKGLVVASIEAYIKEHKLYRLKPPFLPFRMRRKEREKKDKGGSKEKR